MGIITKNKQTYENLQKMVKRAFGEDTEITSYTELTEGFCNIAYRLSLSNGIHTILKISPDIHVKMLSGEVKLMETEVSAMKLAREKNLVYTPEVYFYDKSREICSGEYFFMEILEGESLYLAKQRLTQDEQALLNKKAGVVLKRLNQEKGTRFGHFFVEELQFTNWFEAFLVMLGNLCKDGEEACVDIGVRYADILDSLPSYKSCFEVVKEPVLIHFDSWDGNIFIKNGEIIGFIDWERAMWADPFMEERFRIHGVNEDFLKGYGIDSLTEQEKIRCMWYDVYLYMIMMIEGTYRHYENNDQYNWSKEMFDRVWPNLTKL